MKTKILSWAVILVGAATLWLAAEPVRAATAPAPVPAIGETSGGVLGDDWDEPFDDIDVMPRGEGTTPVESIRILFYDRIIPQFKYLFAFVALLIWVVYLLIMVNSAGKEELISEQKKNLYWGIAGFLLISLAVEIGEVFTPTRANTEIIDQPGAELIFTKITAFLQLALTPIAIATVFYAGFKFITASGEEEQITSAKKIFLYGFAGLLVAMFADPLVRTVLYPADQAPGDDEVTSFAVQMVGLLRFILTFLGVVAMATFLVAGGYFVTSFGDEDRHRKAKEIIGGSLLGIVIILSAFAIVSAFNPS